MVVLVANSATGQADLTKFGGMTITYSATAEVYMQLRPATKEHGGDQHIVKLPSTNGMFATKYYPFTSDSWTFHPELGKPTFPLETALKTARLLDFVSPRAVTFVVQSLRFGEYAPPCTP